MEALINQLLNLDAQSLLFIQDHLRFEAITPAVVAFTRTGTAGILWIVISALLLIPKKTRKTGVLCLVALAAEFCLVNLWMKGYVNRTRPYEVIEGLKCLVPPENDASFPSGHTSSAFAVATVIYKNRPKRLGVPVMIVAIAMALSRLYVGVHYPSDVIAGAVIGALFGLIVFWIFGDRQYKKKARKRKK